MFDKASRYQWRIDQLIATKLGQTLEKQQRRGAMDIDDKGLVLPPEEWSFIPKGNHPSGEFFGAKACGANFRALLEKHPTYIDPHSSLAGAWMAMLMESRTLNWNPDYEFSHLHEDQLLYNISPGIGSIQHFCPDAQIGLDLGWGGLLEKIRRYRDENAPEDTGFYDGLEDIVLGVQDWIGRHAEDAEKLAGEQSDPELEKNLLTLADICRKSVTDPPETFREACQWLSWLMMVAAMYNHSGALGQVDELLRPYYERDVANGVIDDDEIVYHLACMLLKETHYMQIAGPDQNGDDLTSRVSFLVLEAAHALKIPTNIAVRVHPGIDPDLFDMGVKYLFEDGTGNPNWMGSEALDEGFANNGYPIELARQRVKCGCHWTALPGREYTMNDVVKINLAKVFVVAFDEMMDENETFSIERLWEVFEKHLARSVDVTAQGLDVHMAHCKDGFPDMLLDLFCHGTIEKGRDVTDGGVEFYNLCIDVAGLATVADSFGAIAARVVDEERLSWRELASLLKDDYHDAEPLRLLMKSAPQFGNGGTVADEFAVRITDAFVRFAKAKPTPAGFNIIPGVFSWAATIGMGKPVGATPNGRLDGAPISHGPNPDPGYPAPHTPTDMARSVSTAQCGYGNTSPLQLDMDPGLGRSDEAREKVSALIRTHFDMGGTMINLNVLNREQVLAAHEDPSLFPDLVVRVTGFSAYFASLSKEFRQLVVDRIIA